MLCGQQNLLAGILKVKNENDLPRVPIDKIAIQKAVAKVKENSRKKFNTSYVFHKSQRRQCQWCQSLMSKNTAFCSDFCRQQHEKAVADYEAARADKDNQRWSR